MGGGGAPQPLQTEGGSYIPNIFFGASNARTYTYCFLIPGIGEPIYLIRVRIGINLPRIIVPFAI